MSRPIAEERALYFKCPLRRSLIGAGAGCCGQIDVALGRPVEVPHSVCEECLSKGGAYAKESVPVRQRFVALELAGKIQTDPYWSNWKGCKDCDEKREKALAEAKRKREREQKPFFAKGFVVNLDKRTDRLEAFREGLAKAASPLLPTVERWSAFNGFESTPPSWWTQGKGSWGCYQSHLGVLKHCREKGIESVIIFEDDAVFHPEFAKRLAEFLPKVPSNWDMMYLGGQHLKVQKYPPRSLGEGIVRCGNVNRTHCFAVHSRFYDTVIDWLEDHDQWRRIARHHVDHRLGVLTQQGRALVVAPSSWIVGQSSGYSDVCWRDQPERFWGGADRGPVRGKETPFVAVMGLHRSGSSLMAGVLHDLGVYMGGKLGGYEEVRGGGFEDRRLAHICEGAAKFPSTEVKREGLQQRVNGWVEKAKMQAGRGHTIAGGKYPHLCVMGDELLKADPRAWFLVPDRPLYDSIESLRKRSQKAEGWLAATDKQCEEVQKWLYKSREDFLKKVPADRVLRVNYTSLLQTPRKEVERIAGWLPRKVRREQIERAVKRVNPSFNHHSEVSQERVRERARLVTQPLAPYISEPAGV